MIEERDWKRDDQATKLRNCIDEWSLKLDNTHDVACLELEKNARGAHHLAAAETGSLEATTSQPQHAHDAAQPKGKVWSCPA